jgi:tight adherence protein C
VVTLVGALVSVAGWNLFRAVSGRVETRAASLVRPAERWQRVGGYAVLVRLGRMTWVQRLGDQERLRRRLELSGLDVPPEAVVGLRTTVAVASVTLCGLGAAHGAALAIAALPVSVLASLRAPEMGLERIAKRRRERIGARVPDLVELLVTTTRAGLSPSVAFRRSADVLHGPLAEEVRRSVRQMDLGVPWTAALQSLVSRTDVPSLRRLASALSRSQRLGTSIGATLRAVAEDLRTERRARAEEQARRAPVKMLFPLVFLVLPAFLLLTVGPVVLATIRSLH